MSADPDAGDLEYCMIVERNWQAALSNAASRAAAVDTIAAHQRQHRCNPHNANLAIADLTLLDATGHDEMATAINRCIEAAEHEDGWRRYVVDEIFTGIRNATQPDDTVRRSMLDDAIAGCTTRWNLKGRLP